MSTLTKEPMASKQRRWRLTDFLHIPKGWRSPLAIIGSVVLVLWILVAIFAPLIEPINPLTQSSDTLRPPSGAHWFGTDELGRDILSRVVAGARVSIPWPIALVVVSMTIGTTLGMIAGYFGKAVDEIIMRLTDLVLAFPSVILAMIIVAATGPGIRHAVIAILLVSWPQYTRIARSLVLGTRNREFVIAGRLMGFSWHRSLRKDILPNVISPILVLATLDFGNQILALAGLSFLGLGAIPPEAEWGSMTSDGVQYISSWWMATFPALAIFTVVVAFNLIGDAVRDALDPRMQETINDSGAL